jgi:poly(3-hydroxybutyrate) depolymerase
MGIVLALWCDDTGSGWRPFAKLWIGTDFIRQLLGTGVLVQQGVGCFIMMNTVQEYLSNRWKRGVANLIGPIITGFIGLILIILLPTCGSTALPEPPIAQKPGQLVEGEDVFGTFYTYVPTTALQEPEILVLIHGTPPQNDTAEANAHYYATNWIDFAEKNGLVLIAPVFNQEDFSSRLGDHAMSGYRGLFGREIGADDWVLRLVKAHQQTFGMREQPFYLYGHSAGGQFTGRFLVTHPEWIKKAVITSAATYPQPDPELAWPFGMGELHADIEWDEATIKHVDVVPDKDKWLAATQRPLTVIVGLNDMGELPSALIPGQKGKNRLSIGRNWVQAMALFAETNGLESQLQFELIPGRGHSMSGLMVYSQAALISQ